MIYMATSLAITAGGLAILYLLVGVHPIHGKTLNSVLADNLFGSWSFGKIFAVITIFSEGLLLLVAAQAGFIDAPRIMANMAVDSWLPHRFAAFSERLTMQNGVMMVWNRCVGITHLYERFDFSLGDNVFHKCFLNFFYFRIWDVKIFY